MTPVLCLLSLFHHDVQPILERHCQGCHRPGEIGPMPLVTYTQVRPWAKAIREAVLSKKMPPWFADPHYGKFANDPSLTPDEIATISAWVTSGAQEDRAEARSRLKPAPPGWNIRKPDAIFRMPQPFAVPAGGEIEYQYIIVHTGFTEDRWVQQVEVRPGNRAAVHHAVIYIREPGSNWLRGSPVGVPFPVREETKDDILFTYTPGNSRDQWPEGMAKLIPAGADLVFQMHYTATRQPCTDQTEVGVVFAKSAPARRVLTLQLNNDRFVIPPGVPDQRVTVSGTLPNDATLLSLYPHMHLRGKSFEYRVGGETLLKVNNYDFYWQLTYRLAQPLFLKAGTRLECIATFDNSRNNPKNPDPDDSVHYGFQSSDEMMIGFFDVAVPAGVDKWRFFERDRPLR